MNMMIGIGIYVLIGIAGRKVFGYRGLVETVLCPISIPCALYLRGREAGNEADQNND